MAMSDSEGEIEYLDEDADIVQKCIQSTQINTSQPTPPSSSFKNVVKSAPIQKKKRKKKPQEENSSDYDPADDLIPLKRLKTPTKVKNQTVNKLAKQSLPPKSVPHIELPMKEEVVIHDYDDPLCLPVKFCGKDTYDSEQLEKWNNLCLKLLKGPPEGLKHRTGHTIASRRVIVLRNVTNSSTRKVETTMWSKTVVENECGEKKTEVCQSVLPKCRERLWLEFNMPIAQNKKGRHMINTVVLNREQHKNEDLLVAYQPADGVSSVFKLQQPATPEVPEASSKCHLLQTVRSRACAPCFQMSWRPTRANTDNSDISCPSCQQPFMSVHNLLTHVRTHTAAQVRACKPELVKVLAKIVDYHYTCRICKKTFGAIRDTRKHVKSHIQECKEKFLCEIGNHFTQ